MPFVFKLFCLFVLLGWAGVTGVYASGPVSRVCLTKTLDAMLAKYEERYNLNQELATRKAEAAANREAQNQAALVNRQNRIDAVLTRQKNSEPLLASELRDFKAAAENLRDANRIEEALAVERRITTQELRYAPKKTLRITPEQEKLIAEKIQMTPMAEKQLQGLGADVRDIVEKKLFLELAQNPRGIGQAYKSGPVISGINSSSYRKLRFAVKAHYRIIYRVNADGTVIIETIGTRESVYQGKFRALGGSSG